MPIEPLRVSGIQPFYTIKVAVAKVTTIQYITETKLALLLLEV